MKKSESKRTFDGFDKLKLKSFAKKLIEKLDQFGQKTLFLLDYELRGQKETGLDIAEGLIRNNTCYLVSNSFQDQAFRELAKDWG